MNFSGLKIENGNLYSKFDNIEEKIEKFKREIHVATKNLNELK